MLCGLGVGEEEPRYRFYIQVIPLGRNRPHPMKFARRPTPRPLLGSTPWPAKRAALLPESSPLLDDLKDLDVEGLSPVEALKEILLVYSTTKLGLPCSTRQ